MAVKAAVKVVVREAATREAARSAVPVPVAIATAMAVHFVEIVRSGQEQLLSVVYHSGGLRREGKI